MCPAKVRKIRGRNCYSVKHDHKTSAKCTSKRKAEAQKRIIDSARKR